MSAGSTELYELFLALTPMRIESARCALALDTSDERAATLRGALVPLAVDAALLGADGLKELALATTRAHAAADADLEHVLDLLESSAAALGDGDESGARIDESALRRRAESLLNSVPAGQLEPELEPPSTADAPPPDAPVSDGAAPATVALARPGEAAAEAVGDDAWNPTLADDMIATFLDECGERVEGLSERLLELEARADDPELVSEIFRDLHTLKGSSAFAGLTKMNRVAHLAEDLIGELREGKRAVDRPLVDVLLQTLDVLGALVERARARAPMDVDIGPLLARLRDPNAAAPAGSSETSRTEPGKPAAARPTQAASPPKNRAAQATLRIDFAKVDQLLNLVGEVVLARGRLDAAVESQTSLPREVAGLRKRVNQALDGGTESQRRGLVDDLQRTERVLQETHGDLDSGLGVLRLAVGQLRDHVMKLRMVPISRLFTKYQRTVRELSHKLGKEVKVELVGEETELDKVLVERLEDPLLHLVRNAVDHGVETPEIRSASKKERIGTVRLTASHSGGQVLVTIEDDGAGMDPERLKAKAIEKGLLSANEAQALDDHGAFQLIFRAGFSTASEVSDVSGRGVGMDVVRDTIAKLKGSVVIASKPGLGSRMELRLPLTLAITQVLVARVGGELVAIPLDAVTSAQTVVQKDLEVVSSGQCLRMGDELVPVAELAELLGLQSDVVLGQPATRAVIVVRVGATEHLGLVVQQVLGRHEVVIKSLGPVLAGTPCAAGATLVGDRILLVVDLAEVSDRARDPGRWKPSITADHSPHAIQDSMKVLVVEDSDTVRQGMERELTRAGFEVSAAENGRVAWELTRRTRFDAVVSDVMMPEMDGYELTRKLRSDATHGRVPIIMVTSKNARIDSLRGLDAGADAYLTKPVDVADLVRRLNALMNSPRR